MKKYKYGIYALSLSCMLSLGGCFNLDEKIYSEVTDDTFTPGDQDVVALLATTYSPLRYIMDWQGLFDLQEETGDVLITPTRPNGWDDAAIYKRMHWHKWTDRDWQPRNTYSTAYTGINNANRIMSQIESGSLPMGDTKETALAELRAIRALWYSILCDTHGNVPLIETYSDEIPEQATRKQIYDFIIQEIGEVLPLLPSVVDQTTYGRMTQWAAHHLLARMYLNAEVYVGTPEWGKCMDECQLIINSGYFSLQPVYSDIFKTENEGCVEMVMAVPYDEIYTNGGDGNPGFGQHMKFFPSVARSVFQIEVSPWGGMGANPQFINSYDPADKRLSDTWLMGEQRDPSGKLIWTCNNTMPSLFKTTINDGYRVKKYEIKKGAKALLSNDFPFYRYTDVLMMKAECLLRTGHPDDAAIIVSEIRARAFENPAKAKVTGADLMADTKIKYGTLDEQGNIANPGDQTPVMYGGFYDELGWEFAAEARRRTDMIRFGTFTTKNWFNHEPQGKHTAIFPLAFEDLNTNPNLHQNPDYNF